MASGDEVRRAFQRIASDDPLQRKLKAVAAAIASAEFKAALEAERHDWLTATGFEYPDTMDEIRRQSIMAGVDINRFLDGWSGMANETLNTLLPAVRAGLERLRLMTRAEFTPAEWIHQETLKHLKWFAGSNGIPIQDPTYSAEIVTITNGGQCEEPSPADLKWSDYRPSIKWRTLRAAMGLADSRQTWTSLRKRSELKPHFRDEPGTHGKSVAITRWLAKQWTLRLPEFEDEPEDKS